MANWRSRWSAMWSPRWLRDLDLDPAARERIGAAAHSLRLQDQTAFGGPTASDGDRRLRIRLAGRGRLAAAAVLAGFFPITFMLGFRWMSMKLATWVDFVLWIGTMMIVQAVAVVISWKVVMARALTPYYATVLRREGIMVCPRCGYRLMPGASGRTCSECGLEDPLPDPD